MSGRDDREAMLARMKALEAALLDATATRAVLPALREELDRIDAALRGQIATMDQERKDMLALGAALDRVRARIDPGASPAVASGARANKPGSRKPPWLAIGVMVAATVVGVVFALRGGGTDEGGGQTKVGATAKATSSDLVLQLSGFPDRVDPVASLPDVRSVVDPKYTFSRLRVVGLAKTGLVDLLQPGATIRYDFAREASEPDKVYPFRVIEVAISGRDMAISGERRAATRGAPVLMCPLAHVLGGVPGLTEDARVQLTFPFGAPNNYEIEVAGESMNVTVDGCGNGGL